MTGTPGSGGALGRCSARSRPGSCGCRGSRWPPLRARRWCRRLPRGPARRRGSPVIACPTACEPDTRRLPPQTIRRGLPWPRRSPTLLARRPYRTSSCPLQFKSSRWEVWSAWSTPTDVPSPLPELRPVLPEVHPKLRHDLCGQPFGMFGRREQRREQNEFRAGGDDLTQPASTVHRSSRDRGSLDLG